MNEKTYKVELMGKSEPTYILESDVVKLSKAINEGHRMVLVGRSLINPSSIARISRAYDVDANDGIVEQPSEEMAQLVSGKTIKQLK